MEEPLGGYERKTVVITGGRGYIGAALRAALSTTAAAVVVVSRTPDTAPPGAAALTADVRTPDDWREIVRRADVVFHLAGNTSIYAAAADPADSLRSTVLPTTHLIAAARELRRVPRVVYASTATVYGLPEQLPVDERVPPRPVTVYDLHKWFAEQQLELASRQGHVEGVSLRLANVYGPSPGARGAGERGVLNSIAARALRGAPLTLYGDGRYLRDYVYLDDVVRAFLAAGTTAGIAGQSFNVGSGRAVTVRDAFHLVAERAATTTGSRSEVREGEWPADADPIERRSFAADIGLIATACGWAPQVPLTDGIDRLLHALAKAGTYR